MLAAATVLTLVWPAGLGPRPVPGVEETKPPWMFLPFYPLEDWFGLSALLWGPAILFGGLALVPFVDRSPYRSPGRRRVFIAIGALAAVALAALVLYASSARLAMIPMPRVSRSWRSVPNRTCRSPHACSASSRSRS